MEIKVGSIWWHINLSYSVQVDSVSTHNVFYRADDNTTHQRAIWVFLQDFILKEDATPTADVVNSPQHYQVFPDKEAIEIIANAMTTEQFYGYCFGNFLKYRLRIGAKDEVQQELGKSHKYKELYEKHKHLCK